MMRTIDIHLVRHGETVTYSKDAGISSLGIQQSRRFGNALAQSILEGGQVQVVCAPTARATETAVEVRQGIMKALARLGRNATVTEPDILAGIRNFQVWAPQHGERDPTTAYSSYHETIESYRRQGRTDLPVWLVELDRFWGKHAESKDPIEFWLTMPLLTFEPPIVVVQRFWATLATLAGGAQVGTRIVCCTHSGPMRAFATWALGHDLGEPDNCEDVRVQMRPGQNSATVTYRNRTEEVYLLHENRAPIWWQQAADLVSDSSPNDRNQ